MTVDFLTSSSQGGKGSRPDIRWPSGPENQDGMQEDNLRPMSVIHYDLEMD